MRVDVLCGLGLWRAVKRAVAVDGDAVHNPMGIAVIKQCFVLSAAVVLNRHIAFLPLPAQGKFGLRGMSTQSG